MTQESSSRFLMQEVLLVSNHTKTDITDLIEGLDIFENLFSPFMSGKVIIRDAIGFWHKAPLIGEETLTIRFRTTEEHNAFDMTFDIYKIDDVTALNEKSKVYTLHFASQILMKNLRKKISRSYSGLTSDIVRKVAESYLDIDELEIEKAKYSYDFVVPNWTPLRTIQYMANRSISSDTDAASYMFYETANGFKFKTIDALNNSSSIKFLSYSNLLDSIVVDSNIVMDYHFDKTFDVIQNSKLGMYGSTMYAHNILSKQINTYTYNYNDDFGKDYHTNGTNSDPFTELREITGKEKLFCEPHNYVNEHINEWKLRRNSRIAQTDQYKVVATIGSDTNLRVGDTTIFMVPTHDGSAVDGSKEIDPYLSGSFLISRIRHSIAGENHIMTLELRKDCFNRV